MRPGYRRARSRRCGPAVPLSSGRFASWTTTARMTAEVFRGAGAVGGDLERVDWARTALGPPEAAVMGQLRAAVRAYARLDLPPADVLEYLDGLVRDLGED